MTSPEDEKVQERAAALSPARQRLLALRLRQKRRALASSQGIARRPAGGDPAASHSQQALWFLEGLLGPGSLYNMTQAVRLAGALDVSALERGLQELIRRHESLRTAFEMRDGVPVQCVRPAGPVHVAVSEVEGTTAAERERGLSRLLQQESTQPFDLGEAPLLRARLLSLGESEHVLQLVVHHIVADGWSMGVIANELSALYSAFTAGEPSPLPPLPIQFADYTSWQHDRLQGERLETVLRHWRGRLEGLEPLEFPTDRPRPVQASYAGRVERFTVPADLLEALRGLARRHNATLFIVLLAAFKVLLMRYTRQEDLAVGSPVAGRERPELEGLIGYFVNSVVLRTDVSGNPGFTELLGRVQETVLDAFTHQELPFDQLVAELSPQRDLSRNPLYQVSFALNNQPTASYRLNGLRAQLQPVRADTAKFDLSLAFTETGGELHGIIEYRADLLEDGTIRRLSSHLQTLLGGIVSDPGRRLADLPLLAEEERQRLLVEWNATERPYPTGIPVHELVEQQAARTPEAVAVELGEARLSYGELNARANQLAHYLRSRGVGPEVLVGVCMERSLAMVVALLAVLKAGGAFVPLDPEYPPDRLAYMLEDTGAPLVLTQSPLLDRLPAGAATRSREVLCVDTEWARVASGDAGNPVGVSAPDHLAYIIYTSGSTGRPKGVMLLHRGLSNHVSWLFEQLQVQPSDRFLQIASISFDASLVELILPLRAGAAIVLASPGEHRDTGYLARVMRERGVTVVQMVPSALASVLSEPRFESGRLRYVVSGGEALDPSLVRELQERLPHARLGNFYGPTETSIDATQYEIPRPLSGAATVPIGRPIANTQCYVLDAHRQPVPVGVIGELYVGGVGLARGYLNQPELTAECFVEHPFSSGQRLYRTGDLVRYLPDGNIEYLGRADLQVKIRGFRIELGEIEAALNAQPGVQQGVVIAREDHPGLKRLVAYVVGPELEPAALRRGLGGLLPDYMVPVAFVVLPQLPTLPNGKLDRKALPAPELADLSPRVYEPPQGDVEVAIAALWKELMGLERVGRHDHFFELGGHSLMLVTLIQRMHRLGLAADVRTVFANQTLSALATAVGNGSLVGGTGVVPPNLIPVDCTAIDPPMLPLVDLTEAEISAIVAKVPQGASNVQDIYPLTALQEGILFHHMLQTEGDAYLGRWVMTFDTRARLERFLDALRLAIERHDALRTAVMWEGLSQPVQVVFRRAVLPVEEVAAPHGGGLQPLLAVTDPRKVRLDLHQAPLLAAYATPDPASGEWFLALLTHHMAVDHVSEEVLWKEIEAVLLGNARALPDPLPFRDFVAQSRAVPPIEHEAYFRRTLGDFHEPSTPFGLADVRGDGSEIEEARLPVDAHLALRVRSVARRESVSAAVLFHVAWALVVARCSGRDDVVFGTVLSGRLQGSAGADRMVGLLMNTLPMRLSLSGLNVSQAVADAREHLSELVQHEPASLALAQRCSAVPAQMPLFSAMINYRHSSARRFSGPGGPAESGLAGIRKLGGRERTNYPFAVSVDNSGRGFAITAHCPRSVDPKRLAAYVHTAVEALVGSLESAPHVPVLSLGVLPAGELHQVLVQWNATGRPYPTDVPVQGLIEQRAARTPEAVAVRYGELDARGNELLSYGELDGGANRLARLLRSRGVGRGALVGLCVERSVDMVVAQLAILKAGAAYVPLDPAYPAERLAYMAEDAQLALLVTGAGAGAAVEWPRSRSVWLDEDAAAIASQSDAPLAPDAALDARPADPAYVIYTSGSTGKPKGVVVPHRAVVNFLASMAREPGLGASDRLVAVTTLSFDIAVLELLLPLSVGGQVVLASRDQAVDGQALRVLVESSKATVMQATPATWRLLIDAGWRGGEAFKALVGGEGLPPDLAQQLLERVGELWNMYGPTETTVWSTCWKVQQPERGIAIGRPIANTQVYILDERGQVCPVGVPGEMYIGGDGVTLGYLHRPELTAERFVADPFREAAGARLYRTGDRGRWRHDGRLEHLGRLDFQVKVRGYRIELGEIESALQDHEVVKQAVVVVRASSPEDTRIVAYVTFQPGESATSSELRRFLRKSLPEHMLPNVFVELEQVPLTDNGKVNRRALPPPAEEQRSAEDNFIAPRTAVERAIGAVWQEILGVSRVSVLDNFFELGGHSLLAAQMVARLAKTAGIRLDLRSVIFETLEQLAAGIERRSEPNERAGAGS